MRSILQGAIFTQRAVDDRENHIDGRQRLAAFGVNQLLRFAAGICARVTVEGRRAMRAGSCALSR